jgi:hypothetical protein
VQRRVGTACAAGTAIRALAQDGTPTCQPVSGGAGDITAVTAAPPLTGGGASGAVSLGVAVPFTVTGTTASAAALIGVNAAAGTGVRGIAEGVGGAGITALGRAGAMAGIFDGDVVVLGSTEPNGALQAVSGGVAVRAQGARHGVSALGGSGSTAALYARNISGGDAAQIDGSLRASAGGRDVIRAVVDSGSWSAIYGRSSSHPASYAGLFDGRTAVNGAFEVRGNLSKQSGRFRIDHPLDPANSYLQHSFVESPEMLNLYTGTTRTNGDGRATVRMPAWFEALNRTFTYQLTPIGSPARVGG